MVEGHVVLKARHPGDVMSLGISDERSSLTSGTNDHSDIPLVKSHCFLLA